MAKTSGLAAAPPLFAEEKKIARGRSGTLLTMFYKDAITRIGACKEASVAIAYLHSQTIWAKRKIEAIRLGYFTAMPLTEEEMGIPKPALAGLKASRKLIDDQMTVFFNETEVMVPALEAYAMWLNRYTVGLGGTPISLSMQAAKSGIKTRSAGG